LLCWSVFSDFSRSLASSGFTGKRDYTWRKSMVSPSWNLEIDVLKEGVNPKHPYRSSTISMDL
jgi:hypothetical protein